MGELLLACGKNRSSSRWTKFYPIPVSDFTRQALSKQLSSVQGWLTTTDEVLERYRKDLESWSGKCDVALINTDGVTAKRRDCWMAREQLAADLTRERDALHRKLCDRADARELGSMHRFRRPTSTLRTSKQYFRRMSAILRTSKAVFPLGECDSSDIDASIPPGERDTLDSEGDASAG